MSMARTIPIAQSQPIQKQLECLLDSEFQCSFLLEQKEENKEG